MLGCPSQQLGQIGTNMVSASWGGSANFEYLDGWRGHSFFHLLCCLLSLTRHDLPPATTHNETNLLVLTDWAPPERTTDSHWYFCNTHYFRLTGRRALTKQTCWLSAGVGGRPDETKSLPGLCESLAAAKTDRTHGIGDKQYHQTNAASTTLWHGVLKVDVAFSCFLVSFQAEQVKIKSHQKSFGKERRRFSSFLWYLWEVEIQ